MKPIAIFQHYPGAGPGHFAEVARQAGWPIRIFCGFLGEPLPATIRPFSAMVSMGGPMSVNDRLAFIEQEALLMAEAVELGIPVLGHCLGSQLLARTLGATVQRNRPAPWEIGWYPLAPLTETPHPMHPLYAGEPVFHWHNENFALPDAAVPLFDSVHCAHQAFAQGPHLGLQFHLEITEAMVRDWCASSDDPTDWGHLPSVQSAARMLDGLAQQVERSNRLAERIYRHWGRALAATPRQEEQWNS